MSSIKIIKPIMLFQDTQSHKTYIYTLQQSAVFLICMQVVHTVPTTLLL
jgi:hypothetical protein